MIFRKKTVHIYGRAYILISVYNNADYFPTNKLSRVNSRKNNTPTKCCVICKPDDFLEEIHAVAKISQRIKEYDRGKFGGNIRR